jgi:hypothetical protein
MAITLRQFATLRRAVFPDMMFSPEFTITNAHREAVVISFCAEQRPRCGRNRKNALAPRSTKNSGLTSAIILVSLFLMLI